MKDFRNDASTRRIGDLGQRYELRYSEEEKTDHAVLGWTDNIDQAEKSVAAWALKPSVTRVWIFDRYENAIVE